MLSRLLASGAFYHWNDRESLMVAIRVAVRNRIRWSVIQSWSATEGHSERYHEFLRAAQEARAASALNR